MRIAITREVSPNIGSCELTFIDRAVINYELAKHQHDEYCDFLRTCGVTVRVLPADPDCPDCCFVEDAAVIVDEIAVITSMGTATRRRETAAVSEALDKYRPITVIKPPALLEGGDVLQIGKRVFVGLSSRTNHLGIEELRRAFERFDYRVMPVPVMGSLHLKTACTAIDDETLLINRKWISEESFDGLRLLSVAEEEPYAANALRVGESLCFPAGFPKTTERILKETANVSILDISEFQKAEAGLTCLSLLYEV